MDDTTSAQLANYLIARSKQRSDQAMTTLEALTPRERDLVREAAVMGFFQGHRMHDGFNPNTDWPKDSAVLMEVLGGCLADRDLYPTITGYRPDENEP